jgi:hypothetical protein
VREVAAGSRHSVALTEAGEVISWGDVDDGDQPYPKQLEGTFRSVAAGYRQTVALTSSPNAPPVAFFREGAYSAQGFTSPNRCGGSDDASAIVARIHGTLGGGGGGTGSGPTRAEVMVQYSVSADDSSPRVTMTVVGEALWNCQSEGDTLLSSGFFDLVSFDDTSAIVQISNPSRFRITQTPGFQFIPITGLIEGDRIEAGIYRLSTNVFVTANNQAPEDSQTRSWSLELLPESPIGDLDGDGSVGASDLTILLGQWGSAGTADLDGNGIVGPFDLTILLGNWG